MKLSDLCCVVLKRLYPKDGDPPKKIRQIYTSTVKTHRTEDSDNDVFGDDDDIIDFFTVVSNDMYSWLTSFPPQYGSKAQYDKIKGYSKRILQDTEVRRHAGDNQCDAWWAAIKSGFDTHQAAIVEERERGKAATGCSEHPNPESSADLDSIEGDEDDFSIPDGTCNPWKKRALDAERALEESTKNRIENMRAVFEAFAEKKCDDNELFYMRKIIKLL